MRNRTQRSAIAEAVAIAVAVAQGMRITLLNLFRKPVTVHYPTVARPVIRPFTVGSRLPAARRAP